jgi:hypothetical protein
VLLCKLETNLCLASATNAVEQKLSSRRDIVFTPRLKKAYYISEKLLSAGKMWTSRFGRVVDNVFLLSSRQNIYTFCYDPQHLSTTTATRTYQEGQVASGGISVQGVQSLSIPSHTLDF